MNSCSGRLVTVGLLVLVAFCGTAACHPGHGSTPTTPLEPPEDPGVATFAIGGAGVAAVLVTGVLYGSGRVSVRTAEGGLAVGALLVVLFGFRLFGA